MRGKHGRDVAPSFIWNLSAGVLRKDTRDTLALGNGQVMTLLHVASLPGGMLVRG